MDTAKRRRRENGDCGGGLTTRRTRPMCSGVEAAGGVFSESEVKEFFAIIHRMRRAKGWGDCGSGLFERSSELDATVRKKQMWRWLPAFKLEDFGEVKGGRALSAEKENMESGNQMLRSIDLNVEPDEWEFGWVDSDPQESGPSS